MKQLMALLSMLHELDLELKGYYVEWLYEELIDESQIDKFIQTLIESIPIWKEENEDNIEIYERFEEKIKKLDIEELKKCCSNNELVISLVKEFL